MKPLYSIDEIKEAFFNNFNEKGGIYFPTQEHRYKANECKRITEIKFQEFLMELKKIKEQAS